MVRGRECRQVHLEASVFYAVCTCQAVCLRTGSRAAAPWVGEARGPWLPPASAGGPCSCAVQELCDPPRVTSPLWASEMMEAPHGGGNK